MPFIMFLYIIGSEIYIIIIIIIKYSCEIQD